MSVGQATRLPFLFIYRFFCPCTAEKKSRRNADEHAMNKGIESKCAAKPRRQKARHCGHGRSAETPAKRGRAVCSWTQCIRGMSFLQPIDGSNYFLVCQKGRDLVFNATSLSFCKLHATLHLLRMIIKNRGIKAYVAYTVRRSYIYLSRPAT